MRRLSLPLPPGVSTRVGGLVEILPQNDPAIVEQVLQKFQWPSEMTFSVADPLDSSFIPSRVTLGQLFAQYLDLSGRVGLKLSRYAGIDRPESETVADFLLKEFNRTIENLAEFLAVLPQIQPRTYSIASEKDGLLNLVVADVSFQDRLGLATGFLAHPSTVRVPLRFIDGEFTYPEDPDVPLLLFAVGSGVAPILAILDHRRKVKCGRCFLFYGLRVREAAPLVLTELQQAKDDGVIDELFIAVSRAESRIHIDVLIRENEAKIWEIFANPAAEVFYCGLPGGYDSVREALLKLATNQLNHNRSSALHAMTKHKITIEAY
jgi:cytochrome P450/NADPH-cytochrome P450 reductase